MNQPPPEQDWLFLYNQAQELCFIPFEQLSLYDINKAVIISRRKCNQNAIPTAQLARLTYNINRGDNSALDSIASFMPYPEQYLIDEQMPKIEGITEQAARDFLKVKHKFGIMINQQLLEWEVALTHRARGN